MYPFIDEVKDHLDRIEKSRQTSLKHLKLKKNFYRTYSNSLNDLGISEKLPEKEELSRAISTLRLEREKIAEDLMKCKINKHELIYAQNLSPGLYKPFSYKLEDFRNKNPEIGRR